MRSSGHIPPRSWRRCQSRLHPARVLSNMSAPRHICVSFMDPSESHAYISPLAGQVAKPRGASRRPRATNKPSCHYRHVSLELARTYMFVHMSACTNVYARMCLHLHIHMPIHVHLHIHVRTSGNLHIPMCVCVCVCLCICLCLRVCAAATGARIRVLGELRMTVCLAAIAPWPKRAAVPHLKA